MKLAFTQYFTLSSLCSLFNADPKFELRPPEITPECQDYSVLKNPKCQPSPAYTAINQTRLDMETNTLYRPSQE